MTDQADTEVQPQSDTQEAALEGYFFVVVDMTSASGDKTPIFLLNSHKKPKQYATLTEARAAAASSPYCRYNPYWILEMNTGTVYG